MAKEARKKIKLAETLPFGKKNLYILAVGLIMLVIGYILMAQPPVNGFVSRTLSPIVLMIAYLVVIPYSIFYGWKEQRQEKAEGGKN